MYFEPSVSESSKPSGLYFSPSDEISRDLKRIYHYLIYDISRVKAGRARQKDELGRIRHILSELRDGFDQASRKVHDTHIAVRPEVRG